jgi:glycosyltransferase involved in cell wall biosynthesis
MGERVRFLEWVPEEYLPSLYRLADVVVLPSLMEGFGLPALEAMACGTPVVAACNSSYPEVLGEAGMLVDPIQIDQIAGALQIVLGDPNLYHRLRSAGLRRAAFFTWERSANQMIALYEKLLPGRQH